MPHRTATPRRGRLLFALLLLVLGVGLPIASALSAPIDPRLITNLLPTARVINPTARPVVVIGAQRPTAGQPPTSSAGAVVSSPAPENQSPAPAPPAPATAQATAVPPSVPTLTNTPVPLTASANGASGSSAGPGQPVATLFPTAPGLAVAPLGAPAPILMYHYIRTVDEALDPLGYNLSVAPGDFERQIVWLREQGYVGVRMDTLARCMRGEALCPPKPIALTFDDGYEDAFTVALPVLQRYSFSATFYIVSGLVGQAGYMSWEQIAALRDAGMEIGAHTIDHPDLRTLDPAEAARQIAQSKVDLERGLGVSVVSFCYPGGFYDPAIEELVRAAGYSNATTTRWDYDYSDMLALPRRRVAGGTTIEEFVWIVQS